MSNILTCQYSKVHNEDLCLIPCLCIGSLANPSTSPSLIQFTNDYAFWNVCFWKHRSRCSFGFQLAIKLTFVSTIRVCTIELMPIACVDHLFHALGISSYCIKSTNGTSLVAFSITSCYKSISWKVMNSPHEYSSKFKGLFTNFNLNIECNNSSP